MSCWGGNSNTLGNSSLDNSAVPIPVAGLSGVTAITAGLQDACAVAGGSLQCWGEDTWEEVGAGAAATSNVPVAVTGLASGIMNVTAGSGHICAVANAGTVQCWGDDVSGDLGNGAMSASFVPVSVTGLTGATSTAGGYSHACALTAAGSVMCWGDNSAGQLGDGTNVSHPAPVNVVAPLAGLPVKAIAVAGNHSCALTMTGAVYCWGDNWNGDLGNGNAGMPSPTPVAVTTINAGASRIATGDDFGCAVMTSGSVLCWGGNASNQLGSAGGSSNPVLVPTAVAGVSTAMDVAAGIDHACALTSAGGVLCWGNDGSGALGDNGKGGSASPPVQVMGLTSGITGIAAGADQSCALTTAGAVLCWGGNGSGDVGNGSPIAPPLTATTPVGVFVPAPVTGLSSGVTAITAGFFNTCALTGTGVQCWGLASNGELGNGATSTAIPRPVQP
jgi:alpha-tubulin suppressor-like RCC1 family protein